MGASTSMGRVMKGSTRQAEMVFGSGGRGEFNIWREWVIERRWWRGLGLVSYCSSSELSKLPGERKSCWTWWGRRSCIQTYCIGEHHSVQDAHVFFFSSKRMFLPLLMVVHVHPRILGTSKVGDVDMTSADPSLPKYNLDFMPSARSGSYLSNGCAPLDLLALRHDDLASTATEAADRLVSVTHPSSITDSPKVN